MAVQFRVPEFVPGTRTARPKFQKSDAAGVPYGEIKVAVPPPVPDSARGMAQAPVMLKTTPGLAAGERIRPETTDVGVEPPPITGGKLPTEPLTPDITTPGVTTPIVDPGEFWTLVRQMMDAGIGQNQAYGMATAYYQQQKPGAPIPSLESWTGQVPPTVDETAANAATRMNQRLEADRWIQSSIETLMREQNIPREWAAYELYQELRKPGNPYAQYLEWANFTQPAAPQMRTVAGPGGRGTETTPYMTPEQRAAARVPSTQVPSVSQQEFEKSIRAEMEKPWEGNPYSGPTPAVQGWKTPAPTMPTEMSELPNWISPETYRLFEYSQRKINGPRGPEMKFMQGEQLRRAIASLQEDWKRMRRPKFEEMLRRGPTPPTSTGGFSA